MVLLNEEVASKDEKEGYFVLAGDLVAERRLFEERKKLRMKMKEKAKVKKRKKKKDAKMLMIMMNKRRRKMKRKRKKSKRNKNSEKIEVLNFDLLPMKRKLQVKEVHWMRMKLKLKEKTKKKTKKKIELYEASILLRHFAQESSNFAPSASEKGEQKEETEEPSERLAWHKPGYKMKEHSEIRQGDMMPFAMAEDTGADTRQAAWTAEEAEAAEAAGSQKPCSCTGHGLQTKADTAADKA